MNVPKATKTVAPTPKRACHQAMLAMASAGDDVMKKTGVASNGKRQ